MLKQAFYILFFYFTGEFISSFIDGFIPGSVIGMILLFLALVFKLVKPANVKKLSTILTENMGLFFLPAGVGLMTSLGVISQYWAVILTASRGQYNPGDSECRTYPTKTRQGGRKQ